MALHPAYDGCTSPQAVLKQQEAPAKPEKRIHGTYGHLRWPGGGANLAMEASATLNACKLFPVPTVVVRMAQEHCAATYELVRLVFATHGGWQLQNPIHN